MSATGWVERWLEHNYAAKLLALIDSGIVKRDEATLVTVAHDDWCGVFRRKRCDCDPRLSINGQPLEIPS